MKSNRTNLTENIRGALEEMIFRGELRAGELLASNAELASRFGVSTLTADRAVRQLVKEGLVYRKQGVGTYISETPQRSVKKIRIGVADSKFPETPMWDSTMGVRTRSSIQYLYNHQCDVKILDYETVSDPEKLNGICSELDGLLISESFIDPLTIPNLRALSIPIVVTYLEYVLNLPFHQVIFDNYTGIREAVEKLPAVQSSDIMIIYASHRNGLNRKEVFEQNLEELGYDCSRIESICHDAVRKNMEISYYRLGLKLSSRIRGKFLFSTSDVISLAMMEAFQEKGLKPGRDFQLLSYDNLEGYNYIPFEEPCLTTIDAPKIRLSERAAELLLQQIGKPAGETHIIRIPTKLVVRKTAFGI